MDTMDHRPMHHFGIGDYSMNWRRSEWISVTTLLTLAGWIAWASARKTIWDQTAMTVEVIRPKIELHDQQLAVINAKLDDMQEDLKYLRRHANR